MIAAKLDAPALAQPAVPPHGVPPISLEQYYSEAGPDYAAWSPEFNMHFGYYRTSTNPFNREAMLEQMNAEVLARLQLDGVAEPQLLDLGCGLGATLRSFARRLPSALLSSKATMKIPLSFHPPASTVYTRSKAVVTQVGRTRASFCNKHTVC